MKSTIAEVEVFWQDGRAWYRFGKLRYCAESSSYEPIRAAAERLKEANRPLEANEWRDDRFDQTWRFGVLDGRPCCEDSGVFLDTENTHPPLKAAAQAYLDSLKPPVGYSGLV